MNEDLRYDRGYFLVWRTLFEKPVWKQSRHPWRSLLIVLLGHAAWKPARRFVPGLGFIDIGPGMLVRSQSSLCELAGITRQECRSALRFFTHCEFLTIQTTKAISRITITNWEVYQNAFRLANQPDNQDLTNGQPTVNQEVTINKEGNKGIKEPRNTPSPPTPSPNSKLSGVRVQPAFDAKPSWEAARESCPAEIRASAMNWWIRNVRNDSTAAAILEHLPAWKQFRAGYPTDLGLNAAFLWWLENVRTAELAAEILEGLARWKASDFWNRPSGPVSVFNADNFLSKGKYKENPPPARKPVASGGRVAQFEDVREMLRPLRVKTAK